MASANNPGSPPAAHPPPPACSCPPSSLPLPLPPPLPASLDCVTSALAPVTARADVVQCANTVCGPSASVAGIDLANGGACSAASWTPSMPMSTSAMVELSIAVHVTATANPGATIA